MMVDYSAANTGPPAGYTPQMPQVPTFAQYMAAGPQGMPIPNGGMPNWMNGQFQRPSGPPQGLPPGAALGAQYGFGAPGASTPPQGYTPQATGASQPGGGMTPPIGLPTWLNGQIPQGPPAWMQGFTPPQGAQVGVPQRMAPPQGMLSAGFNSQSLGGMPRG